LTGTAVAARRWPVAVTLSAGNPTFYFSRVAYQRSLFVSRVLFSSSSMLISAHVKFARAHQNFWLAGSFPIFQYLQFAAQHIPFPLAQPPP
jgi:hypothetical protein